MENELLAGPLLEFSDKYSALRQSERQMHLAVNRAIGELLSKLKAKLALGDTVEATRVADGLERIKIKLVDFQLKYRQQELELSALLQTLLARAREFTVKPPQFLLTSRIELGLIANYLLRAGYFDSFTSLCSESGLDLGGEERMYKQRRLISNQLQHATHPEYEEALRFCAEHATALKQDKSRLQFHLRLAQFRQLGRDVPKAIEFARLHLVEHAQDPELQVALVDLMTSTVDGTSPTLSREFEQACDKLNCLLPVSPLELLVKLGLIVHKTRACGKPAAMAAAATAMEADRCPCCDGVLCRGARGP
ncbi:hypothetical protein BASA81_007289 [Batrachochytrium salamandrivorans]|nr:hypothetical protein BASA81_007289 [Batrachochytrium salamandrivorans]